jgi:hypothetical protein
MSSVTRNNYEFYLLDNICPICFRLIEVSSKELCVKEEIAWYKLISSGNIYI